jgi:hypothetical protein
MSSEFHCLHCGAKIDPADTNVATDLALCRACGKTMPFSALADAGGLAAVDLSAPPRGVLVGHSLISGIDVTYRRINPVVFFLIPFTALWSGLSLWGIYGPQFTKGEFDPTIALAGLPFVLGTVVLLGTITFMLLGRWQVRLDRRRCHVFTGVGPLGRERSIPLEAGTTVRLETGKFRINNRPQLEIVVTTGDRSMRFGATLPADVRLFLAAVLRQAAQAA